MLVTVAWYSRAGIDAIGPSRYTGKWWMRARFLELVDYIRLWRRLTANARDDQQHAAAGCGLGF